MWETCCDRSCKNNTTTKRVDYLPRQKLVWGMLLMIWWRRYYVSSGVSRLKVRFVNTFYSGLFRSDVWDPCAFLPPCCRWSDYWVSFPLAVETHFLGQWTPPKDWLSLKRSSLKHTFALLVPGTMGPMHQRGRNAPHNTAGKDGDIRRTGRVWFTVQLLVIQGSGIPLKSAAVWFPQNN